MNIIFFCDEKDENGNLIVSKLGELIIDAKDKYDPLKKKVIVEMKIGGTFVSAQLDMKIVMKKLMLNVFLIKLFY